MSKPPFNPNQPFEAADAGAKPRFDPSKPFEPVTEQMAHPAPPVRQKTGKLNSAWRGALQGASGRFGDELAAGFAPVTDAIFERLHPDARKIPANQSVNDLRDYERTQNRMAQEDHPGIYGLSEAAGGAPAAIGAGPALSPFKATQGAGLLARAAVAARNGALGGSAIGALYGAGGSEAPASAGVARDTARGFGEGGALGAGLGFGGSALASGARGAVNAAKKFIRVTPTPEAQMLRRAGVNLTTGQLNPDSALGQIEEIGTSAPVSGPGIQSMRDEAVSQWRNAALNKALPPGMEPPTGGVQDRLRKIYEGFDPAYAEFKDAPIAPVHPSGKPLRQALAEAIGDPNTYATDDTRRAANSFLQGQLSAPRNASFDVTDPAGLEAADAWIAKQKAKYAAPMSGEGTVAEGGRAPSSVNAPDIETAGDLLKARSNIRKMLRSARTRGNYELADLLGNAESAISDTVETQLGPEQAQRLQAVDRQYSRFATLEDAAGRGGTESEFTPRQLYSAVQKGAGKRAATQGRAGDLQDWAQAGSRVFDARTPLTGARVLSALPGGKFLNGAISYGINRPGAQEALLAPRLLGPPDEQVRTLALIRALRERAANGPFRAAAEGDRDQ